jgi:ABC-type transport system involved in multi-copper enzyme maturation permease subunit
MFLRLLSIEIHKTLKQPALWISSAALLLLALAILAHHIQIARGYLPTPGGLEQDLLFGLTFFNWIGILVYASIAAVIMAFDYPDRSMQLWLVRGVARPQLLLARLAAILLFSFLLVILTVLAVLGLSVLSRSLFFGGVDASHLNWALLFPVAVRIFWSSLPYLALTALAAILSRSPLFAVGTGIGYGSLLEALLLSQRGASSRTCRACARKSSIHSPGFPSASSKSCA